MKKPDHPDNVHVGDRIQLMGGPHDGWEGIVIYKGENGILVVQMDSGEIVTMLHDPKEAV